MRTALVARLGVLMMVMLALMSVAPTVATAATQTTATDPRTPIMQRERLSARQLADWYGDRHPPHWTPRATVPIRTLAAIYIEEGRHEGVAGDLAFAQAVLETAYFHFPASGQVRPSYNNFAGIGACDGGTCDVARWPTARLGVRGQIHHLRAYADATVTAASLANPLQSPRFHLVTKGIAPHWEDLGNGRWASDPGYSTKILTLYADMLEHARDNGGLRVSTFTDVLAGSTHHRSIEALAAANITRGCTTYAFCPTQATTRGQMAIFLFRALELDPVHAGPFTDVSGEQRLATNALTGAGIVRGCTPTTFCPQRPITRGEMATLLTRTLDLPESNGAARFTDVDARWAQARMIGAVADAGIALGYPDGRFRPSAPITREQMASFLDRAGLVG